jgi:hypothetical protein
MLGLSSLFLLGLDALIFFEFIRPFRDNNIDQPLGLAAAALGAILSVLAIGLRKGATVLNIITLLLNVGALIAVSLIVRSLSHMKIM